MPHINPSTGSKGVVERFVKKIKKEEEEHKSEEPDVVDEIQISEELKRDWASSGSENLSVNI